MSIQGLRERMEECPEVEFEKEWHRTDGNPEPVTREEVIEWLKEREAQGITSTTQIPEHFLNASPIRFHFGKLLFRMLETRYFPVTIH
jgi:hypothetical protein